MKIIILGSGTSTGVPQIGCTCEVCTSKDKKDRRLRASVMVETRGKRILIDCGPDFREQMLRCDFKKIDAVLITHEHYDHVGGLDDLRPFCSFGEVPVYAEEYVVNDLEVRMPYCFTTRRYPGSPNISLRKVVPDRPFYIGEVEVLPIRVLHGHLPILGYRIDKMAYITDMLTLPEKEYQHLQGLDCLIINALRIQTHPTHQSLEEALEQVKLISAKETYFIHMSHQVGKHESIEKQLPPHVHFTYDGMEIKV